MVIETFLCSQKEGVGQEPSAQNKNLVTGLVFFFNSLLGKFLVIDQVEMRDACSV